jgi:hypothetical protein
MRWLIGDGVTWSRSGRRAAAAERRYRRQGGGLGVDRCLIFVADPPFIRHDVEKSATENERLHESGVDDDATQVITWTMMMIVGPQNPCHSPTL